MRIAAIETLALDRTVAVHAGPIERGLAPLRAIRDAVGGAMDVALEFHGYWNLPSAVAIARASEPYRPPWLEEEYDGSVCGTPVATDGSFAPAEAPGLGVALSPRLLARADLRRRKAAL